MKNIIISILLLIVNLCCSQQLNINYDTNINLRISSNTNKYYIVESSTNLINWQYFNSEKTDQTGKAILTDITNKIVKFYRLKEAVIGPKMSIINSDNYYAINGFRGLSNELRILYFNFSSNNCSVLEEDASPGIRKLITFAMQIVNKGDCDWKAPSLQERTDLYHYAPCHGHYHLLDYSKFVLYSTNGNTISSSKKQGWCAMPIFQYYEYNPVPYYNRYSCTNTGMLPGWGDIYQYNSGMWIDVTDVPNGFYIAHFEIDPLHLYGDGGNARLKFLIEMYGDNLRVINEIN